MNKQQYRAQPASSGSRGKFEQMTLQQQLDTRLFCPQPRNKVSGFDKMRDNDRPISFSSNLFVKPETVDIEVAQDLESEHDINMSKKNCLLEVETKPSLFATFALSSEAQQPESELPYFKQLEIEDVIQPKSQAEEDQIVKAASYSSNFITTQMDDWAKDVPYRSVSSQNPIRKQKPKNQVVEESQTPHIPKGKVMESQGLIHISKNKYQHITFKITEDVLNIQNVPLQIKLIAKVKIYPVDQTMPSYNLLKISTKGVRQQLLIGLKKNTKYIDFALPYFTFAKLVIKKLKYLGISDITEWDLPERQPTCFYMKKKAILISSDSKSKTKENKKNCREKSNDKILTNINKEGITPSIKQVTCQANTYIHGKIFKKSRHFGRWQKRYITINQLGIFSYRSSENENASIQIERKSIKYIWTWFSLLLEEGHEDEQSRKVFEYQEIELFALLRKPSVMSYNKYLIIKVKHGFSDQTEFAVPICNFDTDSKGKNWLYGFYKVLPILEKDR